MKQRQKLLTEEQWELVEPMLPPPKRRRDNRGLRTIMDMSGEFRARYVLTNAFEEPIFVLFKCPHPRTENGDNQGLLAGELKLQASPNGVQEDTTNAWFWSGTLEAHGAANIEISYQVASLKGVAYRLGDRTEPERRQVLAHLLADELEEIDDELGFAREALAQLRVLCGYADRAGVQMTDAHHHAAAHHQRRTGEAKLFGAEQCRDHDVSPGLELPIALHHNAIAQTILHQRLLRLGDAELPRRAGVLDRRQR